MKDHRFIELVNLYIDRQITAAETAELEAEIQGNPRRRAVYRQYCQMHRATTLVYDSFRAQAPDQQTAEPSTRSTIARMDNRQRGRRYRWVSYAGGLAAAACLALVFARLNTKPARESNLVADGDSPKSTPVALALPPGPAISIPVHESAELRAGLVSLRNAAAAEPDYAALRQEEQRAFANSQIQSGRLPSLFEDGVFDSQQVMPATYQRTFRSRQTPAQPLTEFAAFQFQR